MSCLTCRHWSLKNAGQIARSGFGCCNKLTSRARFFSEIHTCGKHEEAPADVIQKRKDWLK